MVLWGEVSEREERNMIRGTTRGNLAAQVTAERRNTVEKVNGKGLTEAEEAVLRSLYRRDVCFWNWTHFLTLYRKFGEGVMGFFWVLLPYGGRDQEMPLTRRRMNEIYYDCLKEYARENYGLGIRLDTETRKLMLCSLADAD